MHLVVTDSDQARRFAQRVIRGLQSGTEAVVDSNGRFQIAPGTERFTVFWPQQEGAEPALVQPDGHRLSRSTALASGRWLVAKDFEMAFIEVPMSGWWQIEGSTANRISVIGDLDIKVSGLRSPVVPAEETSVLLELFHWGRKLQSPEFLDLLEVDAWLVQAGKRQPLAIERSEAGFRAFFVNLDDGAYEFEAKVVGPTFSNQVVLPFHAKNPVHVCLRATEADISAWLSFTHTAVNYGSIKATAKVRRPPQLAVLVPAEPMPSGLWRIPIENNVGIAELTFSLAGNYLNGEGFFLKTKPVAISLPLAPDSETHFRFDTQGRRTDIDEVGQQSAIRVAETAFEAPAAKPNQQLPELVAAVAVTPPISPSSNVLPWWFVALISSISLSLAGFVWWFFRPIPLQLVALQTENAEWVAEPS